MKKVTRKSSPKAVKVQLELGESSHCLYQTAMANFISEKPERFELVEGKEVLKGTLYWCDTYLEAQVFRAYLKAKLKVETGLYADDGYDFHWVVASPLKFK